MALLAYALTTEQRVADFMGLGTLAVGSAKYNKVQLLINYATSFIETKLGYRVKKTVHTQELYDSDENAGALILRARPVVAGEAFTIELRANGLNEDDWETLNSELYFVDNDAGIAYSASGTSFMRCRQGYRVTYTAGYDYDNSTTFLSDTTAGDLELAAMMLVSSVYNRGASGGGISSESIGDYRVSYNKAIMDNPEVQAILDNYAGVGMAGPQTPFQFA